MRDGKSYLQRRCRWLRAFATVLTVCFGLVLALDAAFAFRSEDLTGYLTSTVPQRLPVLFYLAGIWTIRNAFARLAAGELFGRVLPVLLRRLGWSLVGGGFASVFLTQWLVRMVPGEPTLAWATFDPSAITVGLAGLLLIVLADLITRAELLRQELDEFL